MTSTEFNEWLNTSLKGDYSPSNVQDLMDKQTNVVVKNTLQSIMDHQVHPWLPELESISTSELV